jgi:CubicO group peptidase (beta-lactamase class C family)
MSIVRTGRRAARRAAAIVVTAAPGLVAQLPAPPPDLHDGLRVGSPAALGVAPALLSRIADSVNRVAPKTTSILIVRHGALVYEAYFGDGGQDHLNDTRSATKSLTSLAVGAAIADGKIPSDQATLESALPDLRPFANDDPLKRAITLQDLLTMSSALDCNDDDSASPGNEDKMHPNRAWTRWAVDLPTMRAYQRDSSGRGPWRYCTAGAFLLGQVVQRAVGERVDGYIDRRLLQPLGIEQHDWQLSPSGEVMTGGGLRLRSRDLAKIALLVHQDGRWNAQQLVPAEWIHRSLSVQRHAYPAQDYGYLFWRRDYRTRCGTMSGWYMAGNGGNAILTLADLDAVVVVTRTNFNQRGMHQQTQALLEGSILPAIECTLGRR